MMNNLNPDHLERKREGFEGQKMIVLPQKIISQIKSYPFLDALYITDIGYFPKAKYHYRERHQGVAQHILIYCTDGEGWYEIHDTRHFVKPGDFVLIPSETPHRYGADANDPWSIYWIHFDGKMSDELNSDQLPIMKSLHFSIHYIQERIDIFDEMYNTLQKGYSIENIGYANSCLWHFLGSFLYHDVFKNLKKSEIHDPINESISWMQMHLHKNIGLEELAHNAHYSISRYSTLFNKKTGYSPIDYFIHLKIQKACQYLDLTDFKIKEIAQLIGYQDPYYFSRIFHKIMGIFPTEYRKKEKG